MNQENSGQQSMKSDQMDLNEVDVQELDGNDDEPPYIGGRQESSLGKKRPYYEMINQ